MRFNISIQSIEDNHITKVTGVTLEWLENFLKTKKHTLEANQREGTKSPGKYRAKKQVKQNI